MNPWLGGAVVGQLLMDAIYLWEDGKQGSATLSATLAVVLLVYGLRQWYVESYR